MELEFDKEIDAILRRAGSDSGVPVDADPKLHLDADIIAAFAENALPDRAKMLYTQHFADCGRCRKQLSQVISLNTESGREPASAVVAPASAIAVPWYQQLFRSPGPALAMGVLALTFAGVLGYLVLQNSDSVKNAEISQISKQEPKPAYQSGTRDLAEDNVASNSASATPANSASLAANATAASPNAMRKDNAPKSVQPNADSSKGAEPRLGKNSFQLDGVEMLEVKPAPSTPVAPSPSSVSNEVKSVESDKAAPDQVIRKAQIEDLPISGRSTHAPLLSDSSLSAPAAKMKARAVPVDDAARRQSDRENTNSAAEVSTRSLYGKSFENRGGVWYDADYNGKGAKTVRRGTDEYKKLDSGLRKIADTLGGTVFIVWKERALKIQ